MAKKQKRVIIAPLAWGLGHATRCIPVVRQLLELRCAVWAVLTPPQKALYETEFGSKINYIPLHEPLIDYEQSFLLAMVRQLPKFSAQIRRESSLAEWLTNKLQPDLIISDNRYGFRSAQVRSVIITHQLQLRAGLLSSPANAFVQTFLKRFDAVWVPDVESQPNFSGRLSHGKNTLQNLRYPGPLSRMHAVSPRTEIKYDWIALLSGPEPQRTHFENLVVDAAEKLNLKIAIVAGQPEDGESPEITGSITRFPHLRDAALIKVIGESTGIVCRSGYSTLCDLAAIQRKALLVPTPGQTEQVYLAKHFAQTFGFPVVRQRNKKGFREALKHPEAYKEKFEVEMVNHWKGVLNEALGAK